MEKYPKITIGITCFNSEATIRCALQSALLQDWSNTELIIVDDFSRDETVAVIKQVIAGFPNATLIKHETNGGPAAARNTILAAARGEFIAFFDDDDESLPQRLRTQYERLCAYEAVTGVHLIACYASGVRRYPNQYEIKIQAIGSTPEVPSGEVVADYLLFNGRRDGVFYGGGTPSCALMARRSTFEAVGAFDASLRRVEDVDFAIRLAIAGGHFIGCPEVLYLQHATEGSDKTPLMNLQAELRLVEKYADYLRSKGRYVYARDWFNIRYYHFSCRHFRFLTTLIWFLVRYPIAGMRHLLRSAPARWLHERGMGMTGGGPP
jgi:glycosyltransferase involved in cell wall biosynthesis